MVHINPIFPYPGYVSNKPPSTPAEGAVNAAFGNNPPAISPGLQADILDIKKAIVNPLEKLGADVNNLDLKANNAGNNAAFANKSEALLALLSPLPPVRRAGSVPDKIEEKNYAGAGLQLAMIGANLPNDITQVGLAFRDGKEVFSTGAKNIPKREYFRECRFLKGTILEKYFKPLFERYPSLGKLDRSLLSSKFGEGIANFIKLEVEDVRTIAGMGDDVSINTVKFAGGFEKQLLGGSLLRLSPFALITSTVMEIPALIRSITKTEGDFSDKSEAFGKQLLKSGSYIGIINAGIAIGGAALALTPWGAAAELVGMAIGSVVGLMASRAINKQIDKIF